MQELISHLNKIKNIVIAFSGGLDSRFLVFASLKANIDVQVIHARGVHIQAMESIWAEKWAKSVAINPHIIDFNPLLINEVRHNHQRRCYYCKKALIIQMRKYMLQKNIHGILCDGTNADDLKQHRPGLQALKEEHVQSPLAQCNMSKELIRALANKYGMENPAQLARPCLLTRFAYNYPIDLHLLQFVAKIELALEKIGLTDFRLRMTPLPILYSQALRPKLKSMAIQLLYNSFQQNIQIIEEDTISGFYDRK